MPRNTSRGCGSDGWGRLMASSRRFTSRSPPSLTPSTIPGPLYRKEVVSSCAAQHKMCWFHSGGYTVAVTLQARIYTLTSFLMATDGRQLLALGDFTSVPPAPHWALGSSLSTAESTPDRAGRAEGTLTSHKRLQRSSWRCP